MTYLLAILVTFGLLAFGAALIGTTLNRSKHEIFAALAGEDRVAYRVRAARTVRTMRAMPRRIAPAPLRAAA